MIDLYTRQTHSKSREENDIEQRAVRDANEAFRKIEGARRLRASGSKPKTAKQTKTQVKKNRVVTRLYFRLITCRLGPTQSMCVRRIY